MQVLRNFRVELSPLVRSRRVFWAHVREAMRTAAGIRQETLVEEELKQEFLDIPIITEEAAGKLGKRLAVSGHVASGTAADPVHRHPGRPPRGEGGGGHQGRGSTSRDPAGCPRMVALEMLFVKDLQFFSPSVLKLRPAFWQECTNVIKQASLELRLRPSPSRQTRE